MRESRKALSSHEIDAASFAISHSILGTELFKTASIIFLYAALPYEVQTQLIALEARKRNKTVAYPSTSAGDGEMRFYVVEDEKELKYYECGKILLREPDCQRHQLVVPNQQSLMVVPGMAFDESKNRLGYGGGYYDRYLSAYPVKTIGVAFEFSLISELPIDAYDKRLDCIVTEKRVIG